MLMIQALLLCQGINRKTINKIYKQITSFQDIDEVLSALKKYSGNRGYVVSKSVLLQKMSEASLIIEEANKQGIQAISLVDDSYPKRFQLIDDPPAIIYVKGDLKPFEQGINIAIIGTREPTIHGAKMAMHLGELFAKRGCNVIGGLALGCDTFAHQGCLQGKGKTLAVLAGGVDKVYPVSNRKLSDEILDNGGILMSEYQPGVKPFRSYFVDRDRLQSALSEVVIVVETDIKGGTMHTVAYSQQQNKILAAYKHPDKYALEPKCQGNNELINSGKAIPIDSENTIADLVQKAKKLKYSYSDRFKSDNAENEATQIRFF